ncbi:MAG TPA: cyclic dehypoxanthinyl futalosine synthase [Polyangia bacterium]|nr:cyclic dehypoxanthinyl futalosine synthase [Polyangia bacterium]
MNSRRIRLAAVSFLNARPITYALDPERFEVTFTEPSVCADLLAAGQADCGLIPVASYAAQPGLRVVPGIAIAARGAVKTVLLVGAVPWPRMAEIALDDASRTSALLCKLLSRAQGFAPNYLRVDHAEAARAARGDRGALVIGDAAFDLSGYPYVYDLGAEWTRATGLPFVYAVWAGRPDALAPADVAALQRSLAAGLAARGTIARAFAEGRGGDAKIFERYLHNHIRYALGSDELAGLSEYFLRCHRAGLCERLPEIAFYETAPVRARVRRDALSAAAAGERLCDQDAINLYERAPLGELGCAADARRHALHKDGVVTYIIDRNVNYTNVCVTRCKFCNFYRPPGHPEGYVLSREVLAQKFRETVALGGVQVLLQGGLHPDLRIEWYEDLFRWIKSNFPLILHALSPAEITHIAQLEGLSVEKVLERLHAAGLDSVPGGGAEILDDAVRTEVSPLKCTTDEWLAVMRAAHQLGLPSSSTMVFGFGETSQQLTGHLGRLRTLQDQTGGFVSFFCWPFQSEGTRLKKRDDTSAARYLRVQALARLYLDNIPHFGVSWPTMGPDVGQVALRYGGNDFGSVMIEENVVSTAGAHFMMDAAAIERQIRGAGFIPRRRNNRYQYIS